MTPTEKLKNINSELDDCESRIQNEKEHRKALLKRAKDDNIDTKALLQARKESKMDPHEREVFQHTVEQYKLDLGM